MLDTSGDATASARAPRASPAEDACSAERRTRHDAEDPRVAAGTLTPGGTTVPWVVWTEDTGSGTHGIFVSRLVGGDHFELFNNGQPDLRPVGRRVRARHHVLGQHPVHHLARDVGGEQRRVQRALRGRGTTFSTTRPAGWPGRRRSGPAAPISSSCTANPFTRRRRQLPGAAGGYAVLPAHQRVAEGPARPRLLGRAAQTGDAGGDASSATVAGSVNPGGAAVNAHVEFGTTARTAAGRPTSVSARESPVAFGGRPDRAAGADGDPLPRRRQTDFGTFTGPDRVFVTGVRLPGGGGNGGGGNGGNGHGPKRHHRHWPVIANKRLVLRADGTVAVRLTCPASHGKACKGTLRIKLHGTTVGHTAFSLKGGKTKTVTVTLDRQKRAGVARAARHGHGVKVKVTAGTSATTLRLRRA